MQEIQFVEKNADGLDEIRISDVKGIEAPFFTPEISGAEGLQALLIAKDALEKNNPVMVPGHRWQDIRSKPRFKEYKKEIQDLVTNHPFFYYEPVEIFRYTRPQTVVTYGLQGDVTQSREFYSRLRDGRVDDAISMLPKFFQPFVERQIKPLCKSKEIKIPQKYQNQSRGKIHEAWRDSRADRGFVSYFETIVDDAAKSPNAAVIPPVPPVLKSSGKDVTDRTLGFNNYMRNLAYSKWNDRSAGEVTSYLHFYLDQGVFEPNNNNNDVRVKNAIRSEADNPYYAGVALTISNMNRLWEKGNQKSLERFITDVCNIARENNLPVILPRSGYYGMHLTDHGVQNFSRLMNGNSEYYRRGGGIGKRAKYGTLPIYGKGGAKDVNAEELEVILNRNGGSLHPVSGIPSSPPTFNPSGSTYKAKYGNDSSFRVQFGKPRRLIHVKEAQEIRDDIRRGVLSPARRYLERGGHPYLS